MRRTFTFSIIYLLFSLLVFAQNARTTITLTDKEVIVASYTDKEIIINGQTDLHLTASVNPLTNSVVNLNSENSWIFFDNIKPSVVIDSYLKYININNQSAVLKTNVRVSIYKHGTVIIPQPSTYQPLTVYTEQNFGGSSQRYSLFTYNNALGTTFDNKIRSFKLKRGYMATLATSADGSGYSRVFIADNADLEIPVMTNLLDSKVSFIRVFNWEWVSKKGWAGSSSTEYGLVNATWRYDWSAGGSTTNNVEYVPIRQNGGWPGWSEISGKQYVSHVLGFNEPDHTEQSNLTVSQALAQWPEMLKSGLRVGSPACTNFSWLYQFMDSCKAKNYRVDYVAVHSYWGGKSPQNWYNDLKYIHERTGRPIWITEWNNGANWTTENWPTSDHSLSSANAAKQLSDIKGILTVLDTASFIERYSIYNWVQDCRAMVLADTLTPAGKYYAANKSAMAFNRANEVIPSITNFPAPTLTMLISGNTSMSLIAKDYNGEYYKGYVLEQKIADGDYVEIKRVTDGSSVKYSTTFDPSTVSKQSYRVRTILFDDSETSNSNEIGLDVTKGGDIQYGTLSVSNVGWNNVLFEQAYSAVPVIIFGSPSYNNYTTLFSNRVKQSNGYRFSFQLAPWAYQNVTSIPKAETIPYFILSAGSYDFGGLKAIAAKTTVNPTWTSVTFSSPFDAVPVVFATQLTSAASNATGVRVRNVTKTGFQVKIQKESKVTTALSSETISYLAITPGKGIIGNKEVIVGQTANTAVGTSYTKIAYGDTLASPVFLAQMQTCNDDTVTATLRCESVYNTYARVFKQREKSLGYTAVANEGVGWMSLNPLTVTGLNIAKVDLDFKVYPNPTSGILYFNQLFDKGVTVRIYDMCGVLVKSIWISGNRVDVEDLALGCYIIKMSNHLTAKFVKM